MNHPTGSDTGRAAATITFAWLLGACSAALVADQLMAMVDPGRTATMSHHFQLISVGLTALLVAVWMYRTRERRSPPGLRGAMVSTTVLSLVHLLTRDTTAGSYMFHIFPVVYLAYHCRAKEALIGAGYAGLLSAAVGVGLSQMPPRVHPPTRLAVALHNSLYCMVVFFTVAVLMTRLRHAQLQAYSLVEQAASVDPLTGLATRKVFEDVAMSDARHDPNGMALILLDVDNFKVINDTYGHLAGDAILQLVAERLLTLGRTGDVACRLGGDEMALLLPGCTEAVARRRAQELVTHVLNTPYSAQIGGQTQLIHVGISAGVGHIHAGGELESLYSAADASLYSAKRAGRGRVGSTSS